LQFLLPEGDTTVTEEELIKEKARTEGARISYEFMKKHLHDFDRSEESANKIGEYLKTHELPFSEENLEKAFVELKKAGVTFTAAPAPAAPAASVADELASIPNYFPKMETKKDIDAIPRYKFRELYYGKHGSLFKARLEAITKRGL